MAGTKDPLQGAVHALHYAVARVEHKAAKIIWQASPNDRQAVVDCIMAALAQCMADISTCAKKKPKEGGGQTPGCPKGFHEEFGICVPDDPTT